MTAPTFSRVVSELPSTVPFVAPEAIERRCGRPFKLRLGANESAFGISQKAEAAMVAAAPSVAYYGDPESYELRAEIARVHKTAQENVLVGSGIDDLFGLIAHVFLNPGEVAVTSLGSYPTFRYFVAGYGGEVLTAPYREYWADLSRLLDEVKRSGARLLYLANPDNPTGTCHSGEALRRLIEQLPEDCVLILDEAYIDFVPSQEALPVACDDPRVIRLRTFSKAHGMAGMRIGYALASRETIAAFNKVRIQFGVNRLAQVGALASLKDPAFVQGVVEEVERGRGEYRDLGGEVGVPTLPSWTNFVSFDLVTKDRVRRVMDALAKRDVFVRTGAPPLDHLVRVTVGTKPERAAFATVFREVIAG